MNVIFARPQKLEQSFSCFLCHFEQNGASTSLIKIAGRNRIFSSLGTLGLEDDELHFNKRPEYA